MLSNLPNLMARKDLLRQLVGSELRSSSAGTILGWLWWFVDPLIMMLIYWVVVGIVLGRGKDYDPYPIFVLCGLLPWKHLANSLGRSATVLRTAEGLIKSIPFPTMVLPLAKVLSAAAFCIFGMLVLLVAARLWGLPFGMSLLQLIPLFLFQLLIVTGLSLAVAALGAMVRDLSILMSHLLRVGFYASPVIYGIDLVEAKLGEPWATLYALNPFAILIDGYRHAIFTGTALDWVSWPILAAQSLVCLGGGYVLYQYFDRRVIKFL